ncbi:MULTISPECIES: RidA family protein [unclassified Sphingopyxis]|uniref:RidA family protein n=1 Tax=unclassified Sphingopyxis TaxID=2614943 RepID=UPI00285B1A5D|nr:MULTISPECIES: RidA family protein [unclassified Sphingopyxis]MDR6835005.1 reactive intermediate/imine deaminase [Sphingopyxis sp. BE122]MDR7227276.1 reactive intermediate/imine deaminase [Sphingopyxis sp. BE259]
MTSPNVRSPHYSPFTRGAGLIFTSGQLPRRQGRATSLASASFKEQAQQALANLQSVLSEAGADLSQVVKTTVYLSDMGDWPELDEVYGQFFGPVRPARSVVPTGPLHFGFRIKIEAIALASD